MWQQRAGSLYDTVRLGFAASSLCHCITHQQYGIESTVSNVFCSIAYLPGVSWPTRIACRHWVLGIGDKEYLANQNTFAIYMGFAIPIVLHKINEFLTL